MIVMDKLLCSTFQAAKILGVTPDTILKWIKAGKIPASRTLGGHYRIRRDTLTELIKKRKFEDLPAETASPLKAFQYCWEYNALGNEAKNDCRNCLVYKTRAKFCYEMSSVPKELGHLKLFCASICEDCDYYKYAKEHAVNVLVITDDDEFLKTLKKASAIFSFIGTNCEYECSAIVEKMRPDIAVIDWSFHKAKDFRAYLANDSRVPHLKIILVSDSELPTDEGDEKVVGHVKKSITIERIEEFISRITP